MNKYTPLHCHSHFSILDGRSKPKDIAERIGELELDGCALTDHGSISGGINFVQEMKKAGKKPILGCELYMHQHEEVRVQKSNHLPVLCKNLAGWKTLIKIVSAANLRENFYYQPRLTMKQLGELVDGNIIGFSGHLGSDIARELVVDNKVVGDLKDAIRKAYELQEIFGKGNFFLEVQMMDSMNSSLQKHVGEAVRQVAQITGIPVIGTPDAHYCRKEDAIDQRVLLSNNMKKTIRELSQTFGDEGFFHSEQFHIPSFEEMLQWNTEEELDNTNLIADMCENFDVTGKPILPPFKCPGGMDADEYLRRLCREGWKNKIKGKVRDENEYAERVKHELEVLQGAGLSGYFLIVQDIVRWAKNKGWLCGPGRGSAAGCLVSYLINITSIDPIRYDLMFERFYNAGRNTADHVSMPDIDMDFPVKARESIIQYIRDKYGADKVSQMVTYQKLKGKEAFKAVIRAHGGISNDEANRITSCFYEESKIADELEEMDDPSIIRYSLEHNHKKLKDWCYIEKGELKGPLAERFAQAIRLEGINKAVSKHAAGVVVAPVPLGEICPMVFDNKNKVYVAGFEMSDLESIGLVKFDVLGVAMLDKIQGVSELLATGDIKDSEDEDEVYESTDWQEVYFE